MMKEILIKVEMNSDKCRTKAMTLIAAQGVHSVSIDGEGKDRFLVTGDIDCVKLTRALRKKVGNGLTRTLRKKEGYADIVSVKEVKKEEPKKEEAAKAKEEPKKEEAAKAEHQLQPQWGYVCCHREEDPAFSCSIM